MISHILDTNCIDNLKAAFCGTLFPANWLSACHDDNWKSCLLKGERLSYPAREADH